MCVCATQKQQLAGSDSFLAGFRSRTCNQSCAVSLPRERDLRRTSPTLRARDSCSRRVTSVPRATRRFKRQTRDFVRPRAFARSIDDMTDGRNRQDKSKLSCRRKERRDRRANELSNFVESPHRASCHFTAMVHTFHVYVTRASITSSIHSSSGYRE